MRIFFDTRMINHPGIGRYIRCLISEFRKVNSFELCLLGKRKIIENYLGSNFDIIDFPYPIYSMQEQVGFLRLKKIIASSILHVPHYNIPALARFNLVVTIHDLIHIIYPQGSSRRFASSYMKFMIVRVLKLAKRVICVSYATKEAIEEIYAEKCFKIEVIHEGAAENFFPITDEKYLSQIKEKYKLPNKFILYVGSIRRHKNINMLLESFLKIKAKLKDVSLVMVGRVSHALDLKMEDIRYLGEIPDDKELTAIYNLASCLCNVSLYEGFSLTILEAQKCSTAVVCSNIPTHVETGGDGIFAVNPTNVDQIEQALYNVLTDNNLRNALIKKGLENTQRFNWADTAAKTIAIYKELKD